MKCVLSEAEFNVHQPEISPTSGLDLIWGAEAIAKELGINQRRAFYILETHQIPAKKVGGRWVVERSQLKAFFLRGAH